MAIPMMHHTHHSSKLNATKSYNLVYCGQNELTFSEYWNSHECIVFYIQYDVFNESLEHTDNE